MTHDRPCAKLHFNYMQGNRSKTTQRSLVPARAKIVEKSQQVQSHTCNNRGTGTISKSFRKYLSNIRGKHEIKELQKTAILGTAGMLQKVLT